MYHYSVVIVNSSMQKELQVKQHMLKVKKGFYFAQSVRAGRGNKISLKICVQLPQLVLLCVFCFPTVDRRNPANHLGFIKPCKQWDKLETSTGDRRISEPSTVSCLLRKNDAINQ